jgi:hypothetical protein
MVFSLHHHQASGNDSSSGGGYPALDGLARIALVISASGK